MKFSDRARLKKPRALGIRAFGIKPSKRRELAETIAKVLDGTAAQPQT